MRKTFLAITLFLAFSKAALAQFGNCTASRIVCLSAGKKRKLKHVCNGLDRFCRCKTRKK